MATAAFCACIVLLSADASAPSWTAEQQSVVAAIRQYLDAWHAEDADKLAECCDVDCDRINARGVIYANRDAIRSAYDRFFASRPANLKRKLSYEILSVRFVTPDVAIVDARHELQGAPTDPPRTVRGMNTVVPVKKGDRWLRSAHRQRIRVTVEDLQRRDAANAAAQQ